MLLVGDRETDRTIAALRRAYVGGYFDGSEFEQRSGRALHTRTLFELVSSVRGIPGGVMELAVRRKGLRGRRRNLVPFDAVESVDPRRQQVVLGIDRRALNRLPRPGLGVLPRVP